MHRVFDFVAGNGVYVPRNVSPTLHGAPPGQCRSMLQPPHADRIMWQNRIIETEVEQM